MNTENWKSIAIVGRQPALGIAELESLYGAVNVTAFGSQSCLVNEEASSVPFTRLGGSVKLARILTPLPSVQWRDIESYLLKTVGEHAAYIPGKLTFGLSVYGLRISSKAVAATALQIKKVIKQSGHSVRMVPHKDVALSSAVVLHNHLTGPQGWELLVVSNGHQAYLAQTVHVQDIDAYTARDQARPHRDAKVGMLPPKLAQIIVNLAVGQIKNDERRTTNDGAEPKIQDQSSKICVLDPFCGTGVLLQEAMLMDYDIYGSDLDPRMVQYTIDNLAWLDQKYPHLGDYRRIEIGDATTHTWQLSGLGTQNSLLFVACETYLGKPLSTLPPSDMLSKIMYDVNLLHHKFLENIGRQIPAGTRLCIAVPAWRGKREFLHLPILDHLTDIGYTRMSFEHASFEELIYHRENQVVARELVVLIKN